MNEDVYLKTIENENSRISSEISRKVSPISILSPLSKTNRNYRSISKGGIKFESISPNSHQNSHKQFHKKYT